MSKDSFDRGLTKRRQVMGDDFVDRALGQADELTMPMQDFVTRVAWDEIWNREALSDRDRSLVNLGMIAALNRPQEFRGHVRGALNNGMSSPPSILTPWCTHDWASTHGCTAPPLATPKSPPSPRGLPPRFCSPARACLRIAQWSP